MSINIHIEKKDLLLLIAVMVFLIGVVYVIAYNPTMSGGTPSVAGHSSDEIMVRNKTGNLVSLQTYIDQEGTITYTACTWIDIYNRLCNGVPGCSFSGSRLTLTMPAPWVVVGGNYNSPDYTDGLYVCRINIS